MGITGLLILPVVKEAITNANIKKYEGATVVVYTYCWIYKSVYNCTQDLAVGKVGTSY